MTLKTRPQISFVIVGLELYFLDLAKDLHGDHGVQLSMQKFKSAMIGSRRKSEHR